jgi:hypothetical protein
VYEPVRVKRPEPTRQASTVEHGAVHVLDTVYELRPEQTANRLRRRELAGGGLMKRQQRAEADTDYYERDHERRQDCNECRHDRREADAA